MSFLLYIVTVYVISHFKELKNYSNQVNISTYVHETLMSENSNVRFFQNKSQR